MSADARIAARAPLDALLVTTLVSLGLLLVNGVVVAAQQLGAHSLDFWTVMAWGWLVIGLAQSMVSWWLSAGMRGHRAAGPMWWAAMACTLETLVQLASTVSDAFGSHAFDEALRPLPFRFAWLALGYSVSAFTFVALWRWLGANRPGLAVAFWGTFAFSVLLAIARTAMSPEQLMEVIRAFRWPWLFLIYGLGALRLGVMALVVFTARTTLDDGAPPLPAAAPSAGPSPTRDLVVGGTLLGLGLVVTVTSISLASSGSGGRYVVATGAITVGLVRLIRGLLGLSKASSARSPLDPPEGP